MPSLPFSFALGSEQTRQQTITVGLMVVGYVGRYFCTSHLFVVAEIWQDQEKISDETYGSILAASYVMYFLIKPFYGFASDQLGGRTMFLVGNYGCAVATLVFCLGHGVQWFTLMWCVVNFFMPATWTSVVRLVSAWFPREMHGRICSILCLSYLVGDIVARAVLGALLAANFTWRQVFVFAALVNVVLNLPNIFFLRNTPEELGLKNPDVSREYEETNGHDHAPEASNKLDLIMPLFKDTTFWILVLLAFFMASIRDFFLSFTSLYLIEVYCTGKPPSCVDSGLADGVAAWGSSTIPFTGCFSVLLAGYLKDKLPGQHRGGILSVFTTQLFICLVGLWWFEPLKQFWLALLFLLLCGFALLGPYALLSGALALEVGGKDRNATCSALIDAAGAIGGIFVMVLKSHRDEYPGDTYPLMFLFLAVMGALSMVVSLVLWYRDTRRDSNPAYSLIQQEDDDPEHIN